MSKVTFQQIPISLDQPDAYLILGIFWPLGGPIHSDEEREQQAAQALLNAQPKISEEKARELVSRLFDMEEAEYLVAQKFCQEIHAHIRSIESSLAVIDEQSKLYLDGKLVGNEKIWSAFSVLLAGAGSIYTIFNPQFPIMRKSDKILAVKMTRRDYRKRVLQSLIPIPAEYMRQLKELRNMQTHIDEYIDDALEEAKWSGRVLCDYEVCPKLSISEEEFLVVRCYDPSSRVLHILNESYNLGRLGDAMTTLKMTLLSNVVCRGGVYHFGFALAPTPES